MKEHLLPASGFKAALQLRAGNKANVFISTFKRAYLLFISRHQQSDDDSSLFFLFLSLQNSSDEKKKKRSNQSLPSPATFAVESVCGVSARETARVCFSRLVR